MNLAELAFNKSLWNSSLSNETVTLIILVPADGPGLCAIEDDAELITVCWEISLNVAETITWLVS